MPYPLLYLALALAAGILAAASAVLPAAAALPGLVAFLLGAWVLYFLKKDRAAFVLLLAATTLFGAALAAVRDRAYESNALHVLKLDEYADFRGTLARSPSHEIDRDVYILKVSSVRTAGTEREVRGNLRLTVPRTADSPPRPELFAGDEVSVSARIYASREFDNFNAPSTPASSRAGTSTTAPSPRAPSSSSGRARRLRARSSERRRSFAGISRDGSSAPSPAPRPRGSPRRAPSSRPCSSATTAGWTRPRSCPSRGRGSTTCSPSPAPTSPSSRSCSSRSSSSSASRAGCPTASSSSPSSSTPCSSREARRSSGPSS